MMTNGYRHTACAILFPLLLLLAAGCGKEALRPGEYVKWIDGKSSGLNARKEINGLLFHLQYKTPEYIVLKSNRNGAISKEKVESEKMKYEQLQQYTLRVKAGNGEETLERGLESEEAFYGRLEYFVSIAQQDIRLVDGNDTLPCALYHYERTYGVAPEVTLVLGFEKGKSFSTSDKTLIYNDQAFNAGMIQLVISHEAIQQIPQISYEE